MCACNPFPLSLGWLLWLFQTRKPEAKAPVAGRQLMAVWLSLALLHRALFKLDAVLLSSQSLELFQCSHTVNWFSVLVAISHSFNQANQLSHRVAFGRGCVSALKSMRALNSSYYEEAQRI